ncbi:MAG: 23S rRNA (adenine(2503)-C(2))-methyltransferase RlmN [Acidobacteriota bacterium]
MASSPAPARAPGRPHPSAGGEARPDLLGLPKARLRELLAPLIDKPFRIDQIYRALNEQSVRDFAEMSSLSKTLRGQLAERFRVGRPVVDQAHRASDGTVKYLFRLHDGATIEAVDIPDGSRRTLCISSQAGCSLACRFCVTGYWGAGRNLTAGEILGQVLEVEERPQPETHGLNLVFMGMGEPLLNLRNLRDALDILLDRISWRRITLSTAGVLPGLEEMASWQRRPQLAISLHAPDDRRRDELMPINRRYPLGELIPFLARFPLAPKERVTFEYLMLDGYNDSLEDADLLAALLAEVRSKVNLIPLNPDPVLDGRLQPSPTHRVKAFQKRLMARGVTTTVRRQRGDDVSAACGQLRAPGRDPRGFRRQADLSL